MVKIFVGNIADGVSSDVLRNMFSEYGKVTECDVLGNYGFVHMESDQEAEIAIKFMDKRDINGTSINVEKSTSGARSGTRGGRGGISSRGGRPGYTGSFGGGYSGLPDNSASAKSARRAGCTKLHIANLPDQCRSNELRQMFERYGYVAECDVVEDRKIAFVHIEDCAAEAAIHGLNGYNLRGIPLKVQMSKNQKNPPGHEPNMHSGLGANPGANRGYMMQPNVRPNLLPRNGGRPGGFPPPGRGFGDMGSESDHGYGPRPNGDATFEPVLPPPAKDRMELLELLDRRRRLEALDPYERRLISCPDPFNLPPPPPEYLRLLRERALVKARLPLPPSSSTIGRSLPTAGSTTTSSALARALVARRAAASVTAAKPDRMHTATAVGGSLSDFVETKSLPYASVYPTLSSEY